MAGDARVLELLEEMLDAGKTPEEVCRGFPELLSKVRQRWQEFQRIDAQVRSLLPGLSTGPEAGATAPPTAGLPQVPGYEVDAVLGQGGMGLVYRARQLKANRIVALKMIRGCALSSPTARLRFLIETEAVARLQHSHIVQLHEAGEIDGLPFFSLEYCDGGTLAEQLKKQRPSPHEVADLIETLARAMHYAHLRGVVHRDLKPGNVLLCGEARTPKITDFGLAKRMDVEGRTQTGEIMGTPAYMAPEQAAGKARDTGPAADVYGLGALLYECLTGRPPFDGTQPHAVLLQVLNEEPSRPSRLAKVPPDLETICLKCLSKDPARRYASAEGLADDLRRFQAGEPIRARPVGAGERAWKWARRRPALAALLVVVLLALVGLSALSALALDREQKARQEADKAKKARDFLVSIFELSDARTQTGALTPRQMLDDAERRIPRDFAGQPELQAELQAAIDRVYAKITQDAPLAMILEARGAVDLQSGRAPNQRAVQQTLLYAGDHLSLGADAGVRLVVLADLHQEWLRPGREATVGRKGCEPADVIDQRSDDVPWTFVRLPKGTFYMGWGRDDEKGGIIQKGVKTEIPEDFEIAVHDVTQGQWQAVMGDNPSWFTRFGGGRNEVKTIADEELKLLPVESVSWIDVQEFIKKLNEKERGRGYRYRLPTEAEWEYACRGGATSEKECSYHFYFDKPTNDLSSDRANANFRRDAPFGEGPKGKCLARPTRVGAFASNPLGLCDMHGNMEQWCDDLYDPAGSARVYRGGDWGNDAAYCRAAYRNRLAPDIRVNFLGFRLARNPVP